MPKQDLSDAQDYVSQRAYSSSIDQEIVMLSALIEQLLKLPLSTVKYYVTCTDEEVSRSVRGKTRGRRGGVSLHQFSRWVRGALGYGLREVSCTGLCGIEDHLESTDKACLQPSCAYARGFLGLGTRQDSPAPFRITSQRLSADDHRRCFIISLFGALSEDHLYWVWGVQRAMRRGLGKSGMTYPLDVAIDQHTGDPVWDLNGSTFPVLPSIRTLSELIGPIQLGDQATRRGLLTVTMQSPLETRVPFTGQDDRHSHAVPSLFDLLLLIVRRLEQLCETFLWPIEPSRVYERPPQSAIRFLVEGCFIYRSRLKLTQGQRKVTQVSGSITYQLPVSPERRVLIRRLLEAGERVGLGRGVVEGRGAITHSFV